MSLLHFLNLSLALGGLLLLAATLVLFFDYYFFERRLYRRYVQSFVWPLLMAIIGGSAAMSLVYSEHFGFIPCSLCWLQRIALYPQVFLSIMAYRFNDTAHFPRYGIALSLFGLAVAIYQYVYQLLPSEVAASMLPCLADGGIDCAARVIDLFGFVTFPFLSAVTFAFLIVVYMNMRRGEQ
jgi:disulfide bond formation protein DsbB